MNITKLKKYILEKFQHLIPGNLSYHGIHHSLSVLEVCGQYIGQLEITEHDAFLLQTAALFHDLGFTHGYDNHEEQSVLIAAEVLPELGYSITDIEKIAGMIRATKLPQNPQNLLEEIIGDSDLDYLGTDEFYTTGETLYQELFANGRISSHEEWDRLQVNFLRTHRYHTTFARQYREPRKQQHLQEILDKWSWTI
ncbi:HD domain-containing protein [Mangrovibacterium lignilyticum]|uniref:HD domain-containing protein n=1 Tax=Mangrovibacterium lignilyticum TaxID=2668052 RepID=UPI0013D253A4|nr:HD domain-containing protein [Mangrovibacterium lignilyticum]